jgi:hypothetical protein
MKNTFPFLRTEAAPASGTATVVRAPIEIPTLESVSARYAKVSGLARELRARRESLGAELQLAVLDMNKLAPPSPSMRPPERTETIEPSARVKRMLGELAPEPRTFTLNAPHPLRAKATEISAEIEAIGESLAALEPEMRRSRHEASAALCDAVRPAYDSVAARFVTAIVELADARKSHSDFLAKMERGGASPAALRILHDIGLLGDPRDAGSPLRLALHRAVETGRCDPAINIKWERIK